ncbi:MAG: glycoside hydrolase family 43 protein [Polyangiaceae bacterium]
MSSLLALAACSSDDAAGASSSSGGAVSGGTAGSGNSAATSGTGSQGGGGSGSDAGVGNSGGGGNSGAGGTEPCWTRITYGSTWMKPSNHPAPSDMAMGKITWDGSCSADGSGNAYATLSNGWQPYFQGKSCVIALDHSSACSGGIPPTCETRVSYGPAWLPAPNHPQSYDDVTGAVTWNGICAAAGGDSMATLSNGWAPHFSGASACDLSFRHTQCGGLYANPVVATDCPDPGVLRVANTFLMTCTPGHAFPIYSSTDLVSWTKVGTIFDDQTKPSWGAGSYWAPELHQIGTNYVAYFSAKNSTSGTFAIGAASAPYPTAPFTDIGHPIVSEPAPGAIDAHYFRASSGKHYLLWKIDGNAVGKPTPIKIQELAPDGLSTVGSATTILTNDLAWEGAVVEGPWMIEHDGSFYLFYSGNSYASPAYGVGVAKASSPLGPFTKKGAPILSSGAGFEGPGHGSIVRGLSGDWVHVYHSWLAGKVNQAPGRVVLVDRLHWQDGWPAMPSAPSPRSQPKP